MYTPPRYGTQEAAGGPELGAKEVCLRWVRDPTEPARAIAAQAAAVHAARIRAIDGPARLHATSPPGAQKPDHRMSPCTEHGAAVAMPTQDGWKSDGNRCDQHSHHADPTCASGSVAGAPAPPAPTLGPGCHGADRRFGAGVAGAPGRPGMSRMWHGPADGRDASCDARTARRRLGCGGVGAGRGHSAVAVQTRGRHPKQTACHPPASYSPRLAVAYVLMRPLVRPHQDGTGHLPSIFFICAI